MDGASKVPLSINMKAADKLALLIMNQYLKSVNQILNREKERHELNVERENINLKLAGIDSKIDVIKEERTRINRLFIKGRITEEESDKLMQNNRDEIMTLEDIRHDLIYNLSNIENKLILLANPLLLDDIPEECKTAEELKAAVGKYLKKIVAVKLGFSRYRMTFTFLDGTVMSGTYYSTNKKMDISID